MVDGDDFLIPSLGGVSGVTYDEFHALVLGIVPGWLVGAMVAVGMYEPAIVLTAGLLIPTGLVRAAWLPRIGAALGSVKQVLKDKTQGSRPKKAGATIGREPWWFLISLAANILVAYGGGAWLWL